MKLQQIFCPSCGGKISGDISGNNVFCPYCGTQLAIDHEKNEITITHNINVNKTERYIDEARIRESENQLKSEKLNFIQIIIAILLMFACGLFALYMANH